MQGASPSAPRSPGNSYIQPAGRTARFLASPSSGGPETGVLVFFVIIVLLVIRRIYRNVTGVRVSRARTIGYTVFYFAFGGLFVATSFFEGVPSYYALPDALVLVLGAFVSDRLSSKRLRFWRAADGAILYRGGMTVYLIYLAGLAARLGIEYAFIGPAAFAFTARESLGATAVLGLTLTDMLLTFGIGLLVGRNIRVYSRYSSIVQGLLPVSDGVR